MTGKKYARITPPARGGQCLGCALWHTSPHQPPRSPLSLWSPRAPHPPSFQPAMQNNRLVCRWQKGTYLGGVGVELHVNAELLHLAEEVSADVVVKAAEEHFSCRGRGGPFASIKTTSCPPLSLGCYLSWHFPPFKNDSSKSCIFRDLKMLGEYHHKS